MSGRSTFFLQINYTRVSHQLQLNSAVTRPHLTGLLDVAIVPPAPPLAGYSGVVC
jgi:hypothetical protein